MAVLKNDLGELAEFAFKWDGPTGTISEMEQFDEQEFRELLEAKEKSNENKNGGLNF
jgi:hypothetical protein